MMDCIFCKIINGDIPSYTVYEDDLVKVILDIKPSTNGDCVLITKKHFSNIYSVDQNLQTHILKVEKKMYDLFKEKLFCQGLTTVQNNDYGQEIKHFHIHLTPRYENDQMDHSYNREQLISLEEVYQKIKEQ